MTHVLITAIYNNYRGEHDKGCKNDLSFCKLPNFRKDLNPKEIVKEDYKYFN